MFGLMKVFSSPNIARGKAAVDLIPGLHKQIISWVQNSDVSETLGTIIQPKLESL